MLRRGRRKRPVRRAPPTLRCLPAARERCARLARDARAQRARHPSRYNEALAVLVDLCDEAGELVRGGANRADRLVVVHPDRAEQADRAERAVRQAVAGADERDVRELRVVQLLADADVGLARRQRGAEQLEQGGAALQHADEPPAGLELVLAGVLEQGRRAADEEAVGLTFDELGESRAQRGEEGSLRRGEGRILEAAPQEGGAELEPGDRLVEIAPRPL